MTARQSGYLIALIGLLLDQVSKLWLLYGFGIEAVVRREGPVPLVPFLDLILVWNRGISYGLFQQNGDLGRYVLIAVATIASLALILWIWRLNKSLLAVALGLILSGAIGNGIDRVVHGAVMDFLHFHIQSPWGNFSWYVFNLADCWIVVGAVLLFYDSFFGPKDNLPTEAGESGPNDAAKP